MNHSQFLIPSLTFPILELFRPPSISGLKICQIKFLAKLCDQISIGLSQLGVLIRLNSINFIRTIKKHLDWMLMKFRLIYYFSYKVVFKSNQLFFLKV